MNVAFYSAARAACGAVRVQCIRELVLHRERADRDGGFVLACTHLGHVEPFLASLLVRRRVHWMARSEFYRRWWAATALRLGGAVRVDRYGYSLPAVRRAIGLARQGRVVGIFPEGGVARGGQSVLRGGAFKHGVCTIAIRARVPVVPVVMLGTDRLARVEPWLPVRRGRVWTAFGPEVPPPERTGGNRAARAEMALRLGHEFRRAYAELLSAAGLVDGDVP
jgi:1-acyl-sn-glycerol-3-phosphate acyltransferase